MSYGQWVATIVLSTMSFLIVLACVYAVIGLTKEMIKYLKKGGDQV